MGAAVGLTMLDAAFWSRQRVLLTGHTGFKGVWLALWLERMGAAVTGLSLAADSEPSLFRQIGPSLRLKSHIADIRDRKAVEAVVAEADPTVAIHMAAQALVRRSYRDPAQTFDANVMGTVHVLEALRHCASLRTAVVVTTDKVYRNPEDGRAFREEDPLGAHDPYSASKAAAEIAVSSWAQSYFSGADIRVVTARAGNVIGGGDWSEDRLVPDIWRALNSGQPLVLRYPDATRPWQHVLEALAGYLRYAEQAAAQGVRTQLPAALNFGPYPDDVRKVSQVAEAMLAALGNRTTWERDSGANPVEMRSLALDPTLAGTTIGWRPRLDSQECIAWTAEWYGRFSRGEDAAVLCLEQISRYENLS